MKLKIKKIPGRTTWGTLDPITKKTLEKYQNCADKWVPGLQKLNGLLNVKLSADKQAKLEKGLDLPPGGLSPNSEYWKTFFIIIPEEGLAIDTSSPLGELQYEVLKLDPTVVGSMQEAKLSRKAEYILENTEIEAKNENKRREISFKAAGKFNELTPDEIVDSLFMLGKDPTSVSPEICRDMLGDVVENNPKLFLEIIENPSFKDKSFLMKLIKKGIVKKSGVGRGYDMALFYGDIMLGNGLEESLAFLKETENQNIYISLQQKYGQQIAEAV